MELANTTVCVTGGNGGLGLALVKLLVEVCKKVIVIDIADQVFFDDKIEYIKMDLCKEKPKIMEVDIFISNLGKSTGAKTVEEMSFDEIKENLYINVELQLWFYKNIKWKKFVFINSVASFFGAERYSMYCGTKGLIRLFNESAQREGSNTLIIYPYKLNTDMFSEINDFGTLDVKDVSKRILTGILKDEKEIYLPFIARYIEGIKGWTPTFAKNIVLDFVDKYYIKKELTITTTAE